MEMRLILGLCCFLALAPDSDGAITTSPSNKAVLNGASNISMSCASSVRFQTINWNYIPVGGSSDVYIASGSSVDDSQSQFYAIETSGTQQSNLIILSATMARAGTYFCIDNAAQPAYAQLIIINSDPVCAMTPNAPTELLYNQTVQMSCSISYTTNTSYVTVDMIWSKDGSTSVVASSIQTSTSATLTTTISTIIPVAPGNFTPFPIYRCNTTFRITGNPPTGSANNAPDYSKSTQLFSSPINVIYLKPANASSIIGARDGDRVYQGTTVTCNVDANPTASYNWADVTYGNTTNSPSIQIWHDGEFRCTAWNKVASTSVSAGLTVYITTSASTTSTTTATSRSTITPDRSTQSGSDTGSGLSDGAKVGIGVGIGIGGTLVLVGIIFAILNQRYEWIKRTKTGIFVKSDTDGKLDRLSERSTDSSRTQGDNSNASPYEPLKILSTQNSTAGPTYEQLTASTNVDVTEHNLPNRPTYENIEYASNANESSLAAYQSLQHRELSPSDAYEAINKGP